MTTENVNLVLSFKLAGDPQCCLRNATRIKVDGRGGLMVYGNDNGLTDKIELAQLQAFSIHATGGAKAA